MQYITITTNVTNQTFPEIPPGFHVTTLEQAAVGATLMLGALISAIPSGKCADLFGRKLTLLLISVLYLGNYILIACATNVMVLIVARLFAGLALGSSCVVAPMYIAEVVEKPLQGKLGSLFSVLLTLGILYTNLVGVVTGWVGLGVALTLSSGGAALAILFIPETPLYLVAEERFGKARRSLMFYRGDEEQVSEELIQLQKHLAEHAVGASLRHLFTKRRYRRPLVSALGVFAYQQFCGINAVVFNLMTIFKAAGANDVHPLVPAVAPNLLTLLGGMLLVKIIEIRGRKFFMLLSSCSMLTGILGLAVYLQSASESDPDIIPILCVAIFMTGFALGIGPIPWVLLMELFTPEIRGAASGVAAMCGWFSALLITFCYPYLVNSIGNAGTFFLHAVFNALGLMFIWFVVPETKPSQC